MDQEQIVLAQKMLECWAGQGALAKLLHEGVRNIGIPRRPAVAAQTAEQSRCEIWPIGHHQPPHMPPFVAAQRRRDQIRHNRSRA